MMKKLFFLSLILLFGACRDEVPTDQFEVLTIKEDANRATPYRLSWEERSYLAYEWIFDESAEYDILDTDQCDWNKLTGLSLNLLTNHVNSLMVSWRYDLQGFLWLAPYYHQDGSTFWADVPCSQAQIAVVDPDLKALRVNIGDVVETHMNVSVQKSIITLTIINTATNQSVYYEKEWGEPFTNTREIYPWFGGSESAPHDITIRRRLIASE